MAKENPETISLYALSRAGREAGAAATEAAATAGLSVSGWVRAKRVLETGIAAVKKKVAARPRRSRGNTQSVVTKKRA
jgi:hypothetical protein